MKSVENSTCLVFDNGLFVPLAERLSRNGFGRVLYHSPFEEGFSTLNEAIIGYGLEGVERVNDIWAVKDEVDVWCFPDIEHAGLQLELESQGRYVWGSRKGDSLELFREKFHRVLEQVGLDVPKFRTIQGLTKLSEFLKANEGHGSLRFPDGADRWKRPSFVVGNWTNVYSINGRLNSGQLKTSYRSWYSIQLKPN